MMVQQKLEYVARRARVPAMPARGLQVVKNHLALLPGSVQSLKLGAEGPLQRCSGSAAIYFLNSGRRRLLS